MGGGGVRDGMGRMGQRRSVERKCFGRGAVVVAGSGTEQREWCKVARDVNTTSICYYFILSTEFHKFE